jgi:hypothetical protein
MSLVEAKVIKILKVKRQRTSHKTRNTETETIDLDTINLDNFKNIDIESSNDDNSCTGRIDVKYPNKTIRQEFFILPSICNLSKPSISNLVPIVFAYFKFEKNLL